MSSLYESYNARFLDLETVGSTFVFRSNEFKRICAQGNTLILGPRGSGKTTLLKMLKIGAQINHNSNSSFSTFKSINFFPVYLAADRQFSIITAGIDNSEESTDTKLADLYTVLVAIRTKFAFLDTVREISNERVHKQPHTSHHYVALTRKDESKFCKLLSIAWRLSDTCLNFQEVNANLSAEVSKIDELIKLFHSNYEEFSRRHQDIQLTDPIVAATAFIQSFEDVWQTAGKKWCLCIDELEILPKKLQRYFFSQFRATDQRLILKIATSPFTSAFTIQDDPTWPMGYQDYEIVNLSSPKKNESLKFTRKLVGALLKRSNFTGNPSPESLLGASPIESNGQRRTNRNGEYSPPRGNHYRRIQNLIRTDPEFKFFIEDHNVDINRIDELTESKKASVIRQAIWQIALRNEFGENQTVKRGNQIDRRATSHKAISQLYTGAHSILSMCEGNPRIIIGVFRELLAAYDRLGQEKVDPATQAQIINMAIARYLSLLSSIPISYPGLDSTESIVTLFEKIGKYFEDKNLKGKFVPESLSTIEVDAMVSDEIVDSLGAAINQGAFIIIEDSNKRFDHGLIRGARLRLSYLLCARYKLPLTYGRKIKLNRILESDIGKTSRALRMGDLFDEHNR